MTNEKGMTNEEVINYFKRSYASGDTDDERQHNEALDMAIKAIEALDKLDFIIVEQLDNSTDFKECMTLRWVLDKISEVI